MAVRKTKHTVSKAVQVARKTITCCLCEHSHLVRYGKWNPVLAECQARIVLMPRQDGTCRHEHPVELANVQRHCELFAEAKSEKVVELRVKAKV